MSTRVMGADEVRVTVPMSAAIDAVRDAFGAFGAGEFELPLRTALADGTFLTMIAHHRPSRTAVVKSVSVVLGRRPAVSGSVAWLDAASADTLVLDAATVTSLRTGAVVGLATDLLAPPDARHLVLVGTGGQAADQLRAVLAVRPVERVTLVDQSLASCHAFTERAATELAMLDVAVETDPAAAVRAADVVCCATPSTEPLFDADDLPERVHVNAIGAFRLGMRELPDNLLGSALVVVDQREAALEESGEIDHALRAGALVERDLIELSDILRGAPADRPGQTVFKSVGLAIQDWAIGRAVADNYKS